MTSEDHQLAMNHIAQLLEELFEGRKAVSKLISESKDILIDGQVMLRQVQANAQHIDQIKEVYSTEQTEQNVAKWCQNFHKQRLANIELKERLNLLTDESFTLKASVDQRECQVKSLLHYINEKGGQIRANHTIDSDTVYADNEQDFATIAVQTTELNNEQGGDRASRYVAENNDVLGQAITDLDKQRALNANLQRSLREKELTLISKDQFINKVKGDMKLYCPRDNNSHSESAVLRADIPGDESNYSDIAYIDHLKAKLEENKLAIFRYELLLEKAHKEQQKDTHQYKQELESVIRERDDALKKVKELQLCLDSIPCRDNDGGQQQQSIFIDQIQSMSETIRLLEKQLSSSRIEKSEMDSKYSELENALLKERSRGQQERDRQEIACKIKAQNFEQENKRLQKENDDHKIELNKYITQNLSLKRQASENPSALLTALIKKMREKLIEKENYIVSLEKGRNKEK
uniref:Interaptin-like n=1 Tax=Hirondellea gigas TaxID=1518452 RepID=A0A6A7G179_9CRUS